MIVLPILVLTAALQRPGDPTSSARPPQSPGRSAAAPSRTPANAYDSSVAAIVDVGFKVADLRATLQEYRRAALGRLDASVLQWAAALGQRCDSLTAAAARASREICRGCVRGERQSATDAYRAYLPRLASAGRSCATRLRRIGTDSTISAPALRSSARLISRRIVSALGPYERHLSRVRAAFGWDRRPRAAPRPGR